MTERKNECTISGKLVNPQGARPTSGNRFPLEAVLFFYFFIGSIYLLKPEESIQKLIISSTCKYYGEYESSSILLTHSFPMNSQTVITPEQDQLSRHAYIFTYKTNPIPENANVIIIDNNSMGIRVCSYLSVLFGKRFDFHGCYENYGFFTLPNLNSFYQSYNPNIITNSKFERLCFPVDLNLENIALFEDILTGKEGNEKFIKILNAACTYYLQALQNFDYDLELSYLNLVTAGEVLSGFYDYNSTDLFDEELLLYLNQIKDNLENGSKVYNKILSYLGGIRKKFTLTLLKFLDAPFYNSLIDFFKAKGENTDFCFNDKNIEQSINAAYKLRSLYVHTGVSFDHYLRSHQSFHDFQYGKPTNCSKDLADTIKKAPTLYGLERIIRYCLIKFMIENGIDIKEKEKPN